MNVFHRNLKQMESKQNYPARKLYLFRGRKVKKESISGNKYAVLQKMTKEITIEIEAK